MKYAYQTEIATEVLDIDTILRVRTTYVGNAEYETMVFSEDLDIWHVKKCPSAQAKKQHDHYVKLISEERVIFIPEIVRMELLEAEK